MKIYVILLLFLAMFVPMAIKYRIMENELMNTQTKPCIINLQSDNSPFNSSNLNDGWSENLKIHTPTGAAADIDRSFGRDNPFSSKIDPALRQQTEWGHNNESDATESNIKRVGKTCTFGLCLPGN